MNIKLSNIFKLYGWRFNQFLFVFVSCDLILEISVWPSFVFSFRYGPISIYDFREPQSEDYNLWPSVKWHEFPNSFPRIFLYKGT